LLIEKTKLSDVVFILMILISLSVFILAVADYQTKNFNDNKTQIFSWWTGGGEAEGLAELFKLYREENPNKKIINAAVSGGGGVRAKAVLKSRMVGGNPPDSFQVHGGAELIENYVKTDLMYPITGLLEKWEVKDKFNKQLLHWNSYQGEIYSIPVNVHRGNVLWYNERVLQQYNIKPPTNLEQFLAALEKLDKQQDVIPIALGDKNKWPATHLFETVLASVLGPEDYNELWGDTVRLAAHRANWQETTDFKDDRIKKVLALFSKILNYSNSDHASLNWQEAAGLLAQDKAAFYVMGDWAEGYFKKQKLKLGHDYSGQTFPGSNSFMAITDTFGLPKDLANPKGAKAWLKLVASKEAQDVFNPIKGSIPSRTDADKSKYGDYLASAIKDFSRYKLTPSVVHGSAARPSFVVALNDIINQFVTERNVENTHDRLKKIERKHLEQ